VYITIIIIKHISAFYTSYRFILNFSHQSEDCYPTSQTQAATLLHIKPNMKNSKPKFYLLLLLGRHH